MAEDFYNFNKMLDFSFFESGPKYYLIVRLDRNYFPDVNNLIP